MARIDSGSRIGSKWPCVVCGRTLVAELAAWACPALGEDSAVPLRNGALGKRLSRFPSRNSRSPFRWSGKGFWMCGDQPKTTNLARSEFACIEDSIFEWHVTKEGSSFFAVRRHNVLEGQVVDSFPNRTGMAVAEGGNHNARVT